MTARIDAITLGTQDINRAKGFYQRGLGFTVTSEADRFVELSLPGTSTRFALYAWDALAEDAGVATTGSGFRATAMSFIVEDPAGVDALLTTAVRSGGAVVRPARSQMWGGYTAYVADPDGHLWKVGANRRPSIFRGRADASPTAVPASPPSPSELAVTLACRDIKQSKAFYAEALGLEVDKSFGKFVSFTRAGGETTLSLYAWNALADDAGVGPAGDGFRGIALSHLVDAPERVDEVLEAVRAAGGSAAEPEHAPWGGYAGYFTDPSGHLWKVAASQPAAQS